MTSTVKVGDVIDVAECDYRHGCGRLLLRVTTIGGMQPLADGDWLELDGLMLRPDGSQVGARPRHAVVRVEALRIQPRRPGGAVSTRHLGPP